MYLKHLSLEQIALQMVIIINSDKYKIYFFTKYLFWKIHLSGNYGVKYTNMRFECLRIFSFFITKRGKFVIFEKSLQTAQGWLRYYIKYIVILTQQTVIQGNNILFLNLLSFGIDGTESVNSDVSVFIISE